MNLNKFKVSRLELARHLDTLPSDWVHPVANDEHNIARVFYDYCIRNDVLLNMTNPDHFEHFLSTPQAMEYVDKWFKMEPPWSILYERYGARIRSDSAILGIARKVWLENLFSPSLLEAAGFRIVPWTKSQYLIEWETSDEALSTFGQGNPPYDNVAKLLRETSVSHSSALQVRVLDTIIDELWGKNTFERYRKISYDGCIHPSDISGNVGPDIINFKENVRKRWAELVPSITPNENDLFPLILRWIYFNSGYYDPRTSIVLPPSEEKDATLQLEVTTGCQWNKCTFCNFYRDMQYSKKEFSEVKQQIDFVKGILGDNLLRLRIGRIFLAGGDSLSAEYENLLQIIKYAKNVFPSLGRISTYASADSILKHGSEKLKTLQEESLTLVYLGIETGSNVLRKLVHKPGIDSDLYKAGRLLRKSSINLSAMIMIGLGGQEYYETHVKETADVLNRLQPRYIAFLNTVAYPGTDYEKMCKKVITPLEDIQALQQTKDIIDRLDNFRTTLSMSGVFVADNPINSLKFKYGSPNNFSAQKLASKELEARINYLNGADYRTLFFKK